MINRKAIYWLNSDLRLFWFAPELDNPEYLSCAVTNLGWNEALDGRDLVYLKARLPNGKRVLNLEDGGTLELVEIKCGECDNYDNKDAVAFRASLCITESRNAVDPVIDSPELEGVVSIDVLLSCKLEIEPDE